MDDDYGNSLSETIESNLRVTADLIAHDDQIGLLMAFYGSPKKDLANLTASFQITPDMDPEVRKKFVQMVKRAVDMLQED